MGGQKLESTELFSHSAQNKGRRLRRDAYGVWWMATRTNGVAASRVILAVRGRVAHAVTMEQRRTDALD